MNVTLEARHELDAKKKKRKKLGIQNTASYIHFRHGKARLSDVRPVMAPERNMLKAAAIKARYFPFKTSMLRLLPRRAWHATQEKRHITIFAVATIGETILAAYSVIQDMVQIRLFQPELRV